MMQGLLVAMHLYFILVFKCLGGDFTNHDGTGGIAGW